MWWIIGVSVYVLLFIGFLRLFRAGAIADRQIEQDEEGA